MIYVTAKGMQVPVGPAMLDQEERRTGVPEGRLIQVPADVATQVLAVLHTMLQAVLAIPVLAVLDILFLPVLRTMFLEGLPIQAQAVPAARVKTDHATRGRRNRRPVPRRLQVITSSFK